MISGYKKHRNRQPMLSISEISTMAIFFHSMRFRQIKKFYQYVNTMMRREFPLLPSYNRFIELMPRSIVFLTGWRYMSNVPRFLDAHFHFVQSSPGAMSEARVNIWIGWPGDPEPVVVGTAPPNDNYAALVA